MIRTLIMLSFWAVTAPACAIVFFPWTFITGDVRALYKAGTWIGKTGVRLAGVLVRMVGLEKLDRSRTYVFMSNHVSNIDPPILIPRIPGRTSVMVKQELFKMPILGRAMRLGSLVPVDRGNRDAGIAAVRDATDVVKQGIHMTIYVEGHRSYDGKLLPFKKGPFYLAEECKMPVVPVTIAGTHEAMPKGRFALKPALVTITFHPAIEPAEFGTREELMERVRTSIESALPEQYRS